MIRTAALIATLALAAVIGYGAAGCIERRAEANAYQGAMAAPVADDAPEMAPGGGGDCITRCTNQEAACRKAGNSETTCAGSYNNSCMAQCNVSSTLVADNGIATSPAHPPRDPVESPGGFWEDVRAAYAKGGLAPAVMLALFGVAVALRKRVAWLSQGKRAVWVAAGVSILAALVDVTAGVGSWQLAAAAIASAIALVLSPHPPGELGAGSTRLPKVDGEP
jgi:hypothetical protein